MIRFSVIIPNHNHSKFLKQRLDSVLQQTYPDFEVIILDDNSQDNSREIIEFYRKHERVRHIIYNEKNSGSPFHQWKKGAELATGEWLWIAESDDFAEKDFLQEAAEMISKFPRAGLYYCDSNIVNETNEEFPSKFSIYKNSLFKTTKWDHSYYSNGIDEINECLKFDCTINNMSSMVFQKKILLDAIDFLVDFRYYADWALAIKASLSGDICYSRRAFSYYRKHESSLLHSDTSIVTSRYEYFKILQLLYYTSNVTEKKRLLDHFVYNYLSFGLIHDGLKKAVRILRTYFKTDSNLALRVVIRMPGIKLSGKKRPFLFLEEKSALKETSFP